MKLEDLYGDIEVILFPTVYEKYAEQLYFDLPFVIEGRVNIRENDTPKIICDKIEKLADLANKK